MANFYNFVFFKQLVIFEFVLCVIEQELHIRKIFRRSFKTWTDILFKPLFSFLKFFLGKYLCTSLFALVLYLHEQNFANFIESSFGREFVIVANNVVASAKYLSKLISRKGLCFGKNVLYFFIIQCFFGSGYGNDLDQFFRQVVLVNVKVFCFLLVGRYKEACTCPRGIVVALVVIFFSNTNIFSLTLNNNKCSLTLVFVLFGSPNNNIGTCFSLAALRVINFNLLRHLVKRITIFVYEFDYIFLANFLFRSFDMIRSRQRAIDFSAISCYF